MRNICVLPIIAVFFFFSAVFVRAQSISPNPGTNSAESNFLDKKIIVDNINDTQKVLYKINAFNQKHLQNTNESVKRLNLLLGKIETRMDKLNISSSSANRTKLAQLRTNLANIQQKIDALASGIILTVPTGSKANSELKNKYKTINKSWKDIRLSIIDLKKQMHTLLKALIKLQDKALPATNSAN